MNLLQAKPLLTNNSISELVDPSLVDDYDSEQMNRVALIASLCIHQSSIRRPQMSQACVVQILRGIEGSLKLVKQFQKPVLQRTYSEELQDAEEYNSTKYLNDMNRHMQIALGL
ncbi:hypothetical protein L1049_016550 [Liquidambar formosana]|uniref:Uncharacterized protein n=1 Tax=Liquidambar formosana TaxID=63359 RepID=A0AAP0S1K0_LIQFO